MLDAEAEDILEHRVNGRLKKFGIHPLYDVNWHWMPAEMT